MKLKDAQKILSGELVPDTFASLSLNTKRTSRRVMFSNEELRFMLRHLAEKVVREKGR